MSSPTSPPRWKRALITWLAMFPIVGVLAHAIAPLRLPLLATIAISTSVSIVTLTWVVMPRLPRALNRWLNTP
jgi:antibiotic biosynthesis monooxygenase (ABM) superfamily enzyme